MTFVFVPGIGEITSNGTVTGALRLLRDSSIDLYFKPEPYDYYGFELYYTTPADSEKQFLGQTFEVPLKEVEVLKIFASLPVVGWYAAAASFALAWLLFFLLGQNSIHLKDIPKRMDSFLHSFLDAFDLALHRLDLNVIRRRMPMCAWLFIVVILGQFVLLSVIQSMVKSDKVTLDSDIVMENLQQLARSSYRLFWLESERGVTLFSSAPNNSIYTKVWNMNKVVIGKNPKSFFTMWNDHRKSAGFLSLSYMSVLI